MSISEKETKILWGRAAGRCSKPDCNMDCIQFLTVSDPTIIGEMAHIIDKKPNGRRSKAKGGDDTYDNLILLCPTCHTIIDKAPPGTFPAELLHEWKQQHEEEIERFFQSPQFTSKQEIGEFIRYLLIENKTTLSTYGPESKTAKSNPLSNASKIWELRKLSTIVPNNRKIIDAICKNKTFFPTQDYIIARCFIEHAEGFERNCYEVTEGIPRFPREFERIVDRYAEL